MKKFLITQVLALVVVSANVFAADSDVAKMLVDAHFLNVNQTGKVVATSHAHPYTDYSIEVPVTVQSRTACEEFVGVQTRYLKRRIDFKAFASMDPRNDVCIAVVPEPVATSLFLKVQVLTGGFVPAERIQVWVLNFEGVGQYVMTLDLHTQSVTLTPKK